MAKRFTQTEKWKKDWYRELGSKWRDIWNFLLDDCNHAGLWEVSLSNLKYFTGHGVTIAEIQEKFGDRVLYLSDNKLFIRTFFEFQYGEAKEGFRARQSALKELTKYGLVDENGQIKDCPLSVQDTQEHLPKCPELSMDCASTSTSIGISTSTSKEGDVGKIDSQAPEPPPEPEFGPVQLAEAWNARMATAKTMAGKPLPLVDIDRFKPSQERWKSALARIEEEPDPKRWHDVIDRIARSEFCRGKSKEGWVANFDFLVRPKTHIAVMENQYGCSPRAMVHLPPSQEPISQEPEAPCTFGPDEIKALLAKTPLKTIKGAS